MVIKDREARNKWHRDYYKEHQDTLREYHRQKEKEYYWKRKQQKQKQSQKVKE